jgi:hypothetical protein
MTRSKGFVAVPGDVDYWRGKLGEARAELKRLEGMK